MRIKINELKWKVKIADSESELLVLDGEKCLGITYFNEMMIVVDADLDDELFAQTVVHELAHAFLYSYGIHLCTDDEEAVCDFMGAYLIRIYKLTKKIVKRYKREKG